MLGKGCELAPELLWAPIRLDYAAHTGEISISVYKTLTRLPHMMQSDMLKITQSNDSVNLITHLQSNYTE